MKTGKKIAVLSAVFIIAAAVYFMWPMGRKEDSDGNVTYTAMEEASLPVIYPVMLERQMAPLFGHREEKAVTAGRDSLLVLPEDRKLSIVIEEAETIVFLGYEIRSMDQEHLIERTELTEWEKGKEEISAVLPIQNLLERETEYQLGIYAGLEDGSGVWYYTRIVERDHARVAEMIALAEEFSQKTFHYESAQDLTMYMESSPSADNSSFGVVTLKNSFTQMTWGTLGAERISEPRITLKELAGDLANIELKYEVARGGEETYSVTEDFTMKWTNQRIYMMDYERRMNELFTGKRDLYTGKRIILGISDGEGVYAKKSADGRFTAFVNNRELWCYDTKEGINARVFAFGGTDAGSLKDLRANEDRHDVEILNVADNGDIEFLVYGYMNRGIHEGWTGISYNCYTAESNTLKEEFFLASDEPFEELRSDVERLAFKGANGIFYLYMNGSVYGIDLTSHEYIVAASGLREGGFAVSKDHSRLAWQDGGSLYDSRTLHIIDLNTGSKTQVGDGKSAACRILGFVGNDCVYGIGEPEDYMMSNGRVMGLYLKSIEIMDVNMETAMHYEKDGYYIRDVKVDDSRIHISQVREKQGGFFGEGSEDTLVCNADTLQSRTDDIGWYASNEKGRIYFVQLAKDISSSQKIRTVSPKKMVLEDKNVLTLEKNSESSAIKFYAYGRGRYLGEFSEFDEAVEAACDCMGFVSLGRNHPIWIRANKPGSYFIRDVQNSVKMFERHLAEFTGESTWTGECLLLDASGTKLSQILYFVGQNIPVLVNTGEGQYQYLTGFDQGHVRIWDPAAGQSETVALDTASERFERLGNDFICCIYED